MAKIILAFDSFKGSLSASELSAVAADELMLLLPDCKIVALPVADGGEGMVDALIVATGGKKVEVTVNNPLMQPVTACYGCSPDGHTAFIEMAAASGLPLIATAERNPLVTTSRGTGEMVAHALDAGCTEIILGIGGSATNDAGMGMLAALGFSFLDGSGNLLTGCGADLEKVVRIDAANVHPLLSRTSFRVACDVTNPFYGPEGAAHIFAAQKGASPADIDRLDNGMRHFATVVKERTGIELQHIPGSGAAGGMGGGAAAFLNASLQRGIVLIMDYLQLAQQIKGADYILTGEGKSDRQTLMGKAPQGVLEAATAQGIRVALLAGRIDDRELLLNAGFARTVEISPREAPLSEVMKKEVAEENLRRALRGLADNLLDYLF